MLKPLKRNLSNFIYFILFLTLSFVSPSVKSQIWQGVAYQAIARDNTGVALINQVVSFRMSIHDLTATGTIVYQETHTATTNSLGLVTLNIGEGTPLMGTFAGVNWANGSKFIQVELDPAGGNSFTDMGTTQLKSVPYALHAGSSSDNVWSKNGNTISNINSGNVGIGSVNPNSKLHVRGDDNTEASIRIEANGGAPLSMSTIFQQGNGEWSKIQSTVYSGGNTDMYFKNRSNGLLPMYNRMTFDRFENTSFQTKNIERFRIDSIGRVGIGTTTPTAKLDIAGNIKITDGTQGNGKVLTSDANGLATWQVPAPVAETDPQVSNTNNNAIPKWNGTSLVDGIMTDNGNSINANVAAFNYLNVNSYGGGVRVSNGGNNEFATLRATNGGPFYQASLELENSKGFVNLQSPQTFLGDTSMLTASGDMWFRNGSSNAVNMTIKKTGNVGLGTTTPAAKLDVAGNVKIADGTQGVGKVLTSDANGLATWQMPAPAVETDPQVTSTNNNAIPKWNGTALVDGIMTDNGNSINANVAAFNYLNVNSYGGGVRVTNGANERALLLATNGGPYYQATLSLENAIGNVQLQSPLQGNTDTSMLTASGDLWFRNGPAQAVMMNIKRTGEIGIGTTTPSAKLEIKGNATSTELLRVTNDNNTTPDSSMVMLNNGNVGIGTLTPSSKLTSVKRNGNSAEFLSGVSNDWTAMAIGRTTGEFIFGICDAANNFLPGTSAGDGIIRINDATKKIHISPWGAGTTMTITDGKVGIGSTSPADKLTVQTATGNFGFTHTDGTISVGSYVGGTSGGGWYGTKSNHNLNFFTNNNAAQMTLTTAGNTGIGTTAPTAKLSVNGTANNTTGAWGVFSDARLKTVNSDFTDGLNVIKKIHPVKFTYKANAPFKADGEQIGIVAQELEQIAPYMVSQIEYGDMKDLREVNNQAYIFLLINAIKEQQKQIEELKALINK